MFIWFWLYLFFYFGVKSENNQMFWCYHLFDACWTRNCEEHWHTQRLAICYNTCSTRHSGKGRSSAAGFYPNSYQFIAGIEPIQISTSWIIANVIKMFFLLYIKARARLYSSNQLVSSGPGEQISLYVCKCFVFKLAPLQLLVFYYSDLLWLLG